MAHATRWQAALNADPLPWLLEGSDAAVRHLALRRLLDRPADDPEVSQARSEAMASHPISTFLEAQDTEGWWSKPGSGYGPKYQGTVWTMVFLDQLGADGSDPRVRAGCEYLLLHAQAANGGIAARSGKATLNAPPPSLVIHCLNGNVLRSLIGFGMLEDERVQRALDWQTTAVTGNGEIRYYSSSTVGPGFCCGANEQLPCAWGAAKVLLALARIPVQQRTPQVSAALDATVELLLSGDPAVADYPMGYGNSKPNGSWFKFGFPSGYVADVLQVAEGLCEVGLGSDPRLEHAIELILESQDDEGHWANRYAYKGKMVADIDEPGRPSKWVTLRACTVLRGALGD